MTDAPDPVSRILTTRTVSPPPNLKKIAEAYVRQAIFSGKLRPAQKIDQDAIADQFGFSKLPVREALISLEHEGIVENIPRRGAFVANLTREDILDHYWLIALTAGIAAHRAAGQLDDEQLGELGRVLDELDTAGSPARMDELNGLFHRMINRAGGTLRLRSALRLLSQTMPENFFEFAQGWNENASAQHHRIFAALSASDGAEAERAMVDHIKAGGQFAVRRLEEVGFWD